MCIFCKIVNKEIPNYTIYEDESTLAFLDINPRAKGHTVVIPKTHAETPFDLSDELLEKLMVATKKAMKKIEQVLKPDGYNVGWNQKEAGGQVVPHLHIHILPRWNGDGGGNMHSIINRPSDDKVDGVFKLFHN
jgi:histidine triad (HIT) family protein